MSVSSGVCISLSESAAIPSDIVVVVFFSSFDVELHSFMKSVMMGGEDEHLGDKHKEDGDVDEGDKDGKNQFPISSLQYVNKCCKLKGCAGSTKTKAYSETEHRH